MDRGDDYDIDPNTAVEVMQEQQFDTDTALLPLCRGSIDLEAEGVDLEVLEVVFTRVSADPFVTSEGY
ncbi:hypothetical protein [Halomontanus rarus]|uniref:hypothetical protein n=1 Tax=Halomontanus rarus TaxID=3034020 RepID=UPI00293C0881|nr:hypothetical protein [Halovivax sp. KZCA124]